MRLVADDQGRVRVDIRGRAPGRGAWIEPEAALLRRIEADPGPLKRSLRRKRLHAEGLLDAARRAVAARVEHELQLCRRAGLLRSGAAAVAAAKGDELLLFSASATMRPAAAAARYRVHLDTEALGRALDRGPRSQVLVLPGRPTRRLHRWLQWQARLGYGDP